MFHADDHPNRSGHTAVNTVAQGKRFSPVLVGISAPRMVVLEDRILYSAAPIAVADVAQIDAGGDSNLANIEFVLDKFEMIGREIAIDLLSVFPANAASQNASETNLPVKHDSNSGVLVVVDESIDSVDAFLNDLEHQLAGGYDILVIDSQENGFEAIQEYLLTHRNIEQIHLVSHGADGLLQLGQSVIDTRVLLAESEEFAAWQTALADDAEILLYGCNVAATESGREFVQAFAAVTGAEVAASVDQTGSLNLGGDWSLEYATGEIDAAAIGGTAVDFSWIGILDAAVDDVNGSKQETNAADRGSHRAIAMHSDGTFVIVWTDEKIDGNNWGIAAQRFAADGSPLGAAFQVNQESQQLQEWASVDMDSTGAFVVTWTSQSQDGSNEGVFARRFAADGTALGNEFLVNTTTAGKQQNSSISVAGSGEFVIVWEGSGSLDNNGIYGRRFDSSGTAVGGEFRVHAASADTQCDAVVSINDSGEFVVAWEDGSGFYVQRFDNTAVPVGARVTIDSGNSASNGSVLINNDGSFAVTWQASFLVDNIFVSIYDSANVAIATDIQVNDSLLTKNENPSIDGSGDGRFTITWQGGNLSDSKGILARKFDADGSFASVEFLVNEATQHTQEMASLAVRTPDSFVVVWRDDGSNSVFYNLFSGGPPIGADSTLAVTEDQEYVFQLVDFGFESGTGDPFTAVTFESISVGNVLLNGVALSDGGIVLASDILAGKLVYVAPANFSGGVSAAMTFRVNDGVLDAVSTNEFDVNIAVEVDLANVSGGDTLLVTAPASLVNGTLIGNQDRHNIATLSGGGFVVVWQSADGYLADGDDGTKVYVQLYNAAGQKIGSEFRVDPTFVDEQGAPQIAALTDGGFIVVWEATFSGQTEILAQRFDAAGNFADFSGVTTGISSPTTINQNGVGNQFDIDVTTLASGGFVISWATRDAAIVLDPSAAVVARFFDSNGNGCDEFLVNQFEIGNQRTTNWTQLEDGSLAAIWVNQNGVGFDVQGRVFSLGDPTSGVEFAVNQTNAGRQSDPRVADLGNGQFIVTWTSENIDGSGTAIVARRFDYAGNPIDAADVQVNLNTTNDQIDPEVLALGDGSFVIAWSSASGDLDGSGIAIRRFDSQFNAIGTEQFIGHPAFGDQSEPRMTLLNDGSIMIAWTTSETVWGPENGDQDILLSRLVFAAAGNEDAAIDLNLAVGISDRDGSQTISSIEIGGIPSGYLLSDGVNSFLSDGVSTIQIIGWDWQNVALTPPQDFVGMVQLNVAVTTDDGASSLITNSSLVILVAGVGDAPQKADWIDATNENAIVSWTSDAWFVDNDDPDEVAAVDPSVAPMLNYELEPGDTFPAGAKNQMSWSSSVGGPDILLNANDFSFVDSLVSPWGDIRSAFSAKGSGAGTLDLSSLTATQLAVELWVRPADLNQNCVLFEWGSSADGIAIYQSGSTVQFSINQSNSNLGFDSSTVNLIGGLLSKTDFNQIVAVWDSTGTLAGDATKPDVALYVNGYLVDIAADLEGITAISPADYLLELSSVADETTAGIGGLYGNAVGYDVKFTSFVGEFGGVSLFDQTIDSDEIQSRYFDIYNRLIVADIDGTAVTPGSNVTLASGAIVSFAADGSFSYDPNGAFDSLEYGQSAFDSFTYTFVDSDGDSEKVTVSMTIAGVPSPSDIEITIPSDQPTNEDTAVIFSAANGNQIIVSDQTAEDVYLQVSLSTTEGKITLAQTTGLTFLTGANGSSSMIIQGCETDLNAALDGMAFGPNPNYFGAATISISTTQANLVGLYEFDAGDASDTSAGTLQNGQLLGGASVVFDATRGNVLSLDGINDRVRIPGMFGNPSSFSLAAWVNLATVDVSGAEILSLGGNVGLTADTAGGLAAYFWDGTSYQVLSANQFLAGTGWRHVAASFDAASGEFILFLDGVEVASQNMVGTPIFNLVSDPNTFIGQRAASSNYGFGGSIDDARVYDRGLTRNELAGLANELIADSKTQSISIASVNDEQAVTVNTGLTVTEGSTDNAIKNAQLLTTDVEQSSAQIVYTITVLPSNGTLKLNGIAVNVGTTFTQTDLASGKLVYDHNGSETAADSFKFSVDDGIGAATVGTFHFTISPVNDNTPVINSNGGGNVANITLSEGTTAVTTVTATDADLPSAALTYSISGGADAALFQIDSITGALSFAATPNFESPADADGNNIYAVSVMVSDGQRTDSQLLSITVADVNEFTVSGLTDRNLATNAVDENAANGTTVGVTAFARDRDGTGQTITYSLDDDAGGRFAIDATTGVVTVADGSLLDRESAASHQITVRATSQDGSSATRSFQIALNDIDEFAISSISDGDNSFEQVAENAASGTAIGLIASATDLDATNSGVTYSLIDDAGGRFTIDSATGVVRVADGTLLDRETSSSHVIRVRADSQDGSSTTRDFAISVGDVDEFDVTAPVDTNNAVDQVRENAAQGVAVGIAVFANDADATNQAVTYSLSDDAGGRFVIDSVTGVVTVADGTLLDFESTGTHSITVQAISADGSSDTITFVIAVIDVVEPPLAVNDSFQIFEGGTHQSLAGWLIGNDVFEDLSPVTVSLVTGPTNGTAIVSNDGTVRYVHNGGETTSDWFTYRVVAANGGSALATVFVNIVPVDDSPTAVNDSGLIAIGNIPLIIGPASLLANDFDPDSQLSGLTIFGQPAVGQLVIDAQGQLVYTAPADFSGTVSFSYLAHAGGKASNPAIVTIEVFPGGVGGGGQGGSGTGSGTGEGSSGGSEPVTEPPPADSGTTPTTPSEDNTNDPLDPLEQLLNGGQGNPNESNPGSGNPSEQANSSSNEIGGAVGDQFADTVNLIANEGRNATSSEFSEFDDIRADVAGPKGPVIQVGVDLAPVSRVFASAQAIVDQFSGTEQFSHYLSRLDSKLDEQTLIVGFEMPAFAPAAASLFTVGYVAWLIRGGVLLTSFVTSLPSWQSFDPLPILENSNIPEEENDTSIAEMVDSENVGDVS